MRKNLNTKLTLRPSWFALAALVVMLSTPDTAHAYIGPGAGFALVGSMFVMFTALITALLAILFWPVRYTIRTIRGRHAFAKSRIKRCIVLGFDGVDPKLAAKYMEEGKLPNLSKLKSSGTFKQLATTTPSISPVAWSSFQTGANPGKHNIFDFLTRDKNSYMPKLSSVDIRGASKVLRLGKYNIPLGKSDIRLLRKGKPFWKTLGEHGVFSSILRVPITFPAEKFNGVQLSAMCVPDLKGTQGTFSYYTTVSQEDSEHTGGEQFTVVNNSGIINAKLTGPANSLVDNSSVMECPFTVKITGKDKAILKLNGISYDLVIGSYTDWVQVKFKAGAGIKVKGICKFLLINTEPEFELYVTPVNIDPSSPAMPISHPPVYSCYLSKMQGAFATLGLAEDSWALNEQVIDDNGFLQQSIEIDAERENMFFDSLEKVPRGLTVCVFDGTDRIQHSFWRYIDDEHPANNAGRKVDDNCRNAIEEVYKRMDNIVGKTLKKLNGDDKTLLMVISDHGFTTFRYGVDLNRWLEDNGYLVMLDGKRNGKYLAGVDWSKTKAYAIGLTGLFLNIKGRESQGIVDKGDQATQLRDEIAAKLEALTDEDRSTPAIKQVYNSLKLYQGPYKSEAPDLMIGYHRGYRASWATAIGEVTEKVFHPNTKAWSGDHCIDPSLVPGVLFSNMNITDKTPRLMDIGPTVLNMFGVDTPAYMDGKSLNVVAAKNSEAESNEQ
ncbi:MAG: nucleotide pyrophosphatase [Planctomycetes bacterium]|nr:nucleotide pyrophosphatase [Planctomycetota bacterium]